MIMKSAGPGRTRAAAPAAFPAARTAVLAAPAASLAVPAAFLAALFLLCSQAARARADEASPGASLESQVEQFTLRNGLKCFLVERHFSPVFSAVIEVDAGAVNEEQGKTGVARMLERLAFRGTPRVGTDNPQAEALALKKADDGWDAVMEQVN